MKASNICSDNGTAGLWQELTEQDRRSQELTLRLQGAKSNLQTTKKEVERVEEENAAVQALLKEATAVRDDSWKEKKRLEKQSHNLTQEISLLTNQTHLLDSEASAKQRLLAETRDRLQKEVTVQKERLEVLRVSLERQKKTCETSI